MTIKKFEFVEAIENLPLSSIEKHALLSLANIYNTEIADNIFPSLKTISKRISKSTSYTRKVLINLSKKGLLIIKDAKKQINDEKGSTSNRYYLPLSILAYDEKIKAETALRKTLELHQEQSDKVKEARKYVEETTHRFDLEIAKVTQLQSKPRQSQVYGRIGYAKRVGVHYEQEEARDCLVIHLDQQRVQEKTETPPQERLHSRSVKPPPPPSKAPPSFQGSLITNVNLNNNLNINTSISGDNFKLSPLIKQCVDEYCTKLAKPAPTAKQLAKFQSNFETRKFTLEKFQRNLAIIEKDPLLVKSTYSIVRVLEANSAIKSKEILKKDLSGQLRCDGKFKEESLVLASDFFSSIEDIHAWVAPKRPVEIEKEPSVLNHSIFDLKTTTSYEESFDRQDSFDEDSALNSSTSTIEKEIKHAIDSLLVEIAEETINIEPLELPIDVQKSFDEFKPPMIEAIPDTTETLTEAIAILREKILSPNFIKYATGLSATRFLITHVLPAKHVRDLIVLSHHPIFAMKEIRKKSYG